MVRTRGGREGSRWDTTKGTQGQVQKYKSGVYLHNYLLYIVKRYKNLNKVFYIVGYVL